MKKLYTTFAVFGMMLGAALAAAPTDVIVRPAPEFVATAGRSLKSFRGQPVVLVIGRSPKDKAFRKQVSRLQQQYQSFGSRNVVFVAAFTKEDGAVKSNIPFLVANDGSGVAAKYGVKGPFAVAVIGRGGNLDLVTEKVIPSSRVMDALSNAYDVQAPERR
jgi:hypothetical protein